MIKYGTMHVTLAVKNEISSDNGILQLVEEKADKAPSKIFYGIYNIGRAN